MGAKSLKLQMRADESGPVQDDWWRQLLNSLILYGMKASGSYTSSRNPLAHFLAGFASKRMMMVVVFWSARWAEHSLTASSTPGLLWENVKNRTPHFTDSHIKRCQVQPRESTIGGSAAPGEQQEFKRLAEQKSLSEQCNMFILTTPAESESETWETCTAIPNSVWML